MLLLSPRMTPEEYAFALTDEAFAAWRPVEGKQQFCFDYDGEMTVYQKLEYMGGSCRAFTADSDRRGPPVAGRRSERSIGFTKR